MAGVFQETLLSWFTINRRDFPWRRLERTPYDVLIAEIMLKRTTTKKVMTVYERFISRFPDVSSLAHSQVDQIAEVIAEIGLRTQRTQTLKTLASRLCQEHGCMVPNKKGELMKLPCVGEYTANAVLCFGFGMKLPIIDSNVSRLVSRYFYGMEDKFKAEIKESWETMEKLLPDERYLEFNYALLDFASLVCKPKGAKHDLCPLRDTCSYVKQAIAPTK